MANIKLKGNVAEHTQFAPSTSWAIGKTNKAKVMLRLASPALIQKRCVAQYHFRGTWKSKRHILPFSDWLDHVYIGANIHINDKIKIFIKTLGTNALSHDK